MTDLSKMSDAELQALYAGTSAAAPKSPSDMTDDELKSAYGAPRGIIDKLTGATGPRYQTWPERAIREMAGLPQRTIEAAASAPAGSRDATEAMIGPAADTALATAGSMGTLRTGIPKAVTPTGEALAASGSAGFDAARDSGVKITASSVAKLADTTMAKLEQIGLDSQLAPDTFHTLEKMRVAPHGSYADVSNIRSMRATLQNAARNFANPREQKAASMAIRDLDAHLGDLGAADVIAGDPVAASRTLASATGDWAAQARSDTVGDAVRAAELSADAANSGKNIGNATRQKFKSLLLNEKESSGFSPEELAQMEKVVSGTKTGNTMRYIGNLLGGGGGLGQVAASSAGAGMGALAGGPVGAVVGGAVPPVIGNVARILSNASTRKQVEKLDEMIRQRSPLFQNQPKELGLPQSLPYGAVIEALLSQRQGAH